MLRKEVDQVGTNYAKLSEKFKGVNIVNDQVTNWAKRVYHKLRDYV